MSDADAVESGQIAPTSSSTMAHFDTFVESYVRYRDGKKETVAAYWRRSQLDRPPLDAESKRKLLALLAFEQRENEDKITEDTNAVFKAKEDGDNDGMKIAEASLAEHIGVRTKLSDRVRSLS